MILNRTENETIEKVDVGTLSLLRTERFTVTKIELDAERTALVKQTQDINARISVIDGLLKLFVV